jgi:hypothetical protein
MRLAFSIGCSFEILRWVGCRDGAGNIVDFDFGMAHVTAGYVKDASEMEGILWRIGGWASRLRAWFLLHRSHGVNILLGIHPKEQPTSCPKYHMKHLFSQFLKYQSAFVLE